MDQEVAKKDISSMTDEKKPSPKEKPAPKLFGMRIDTSTGAPYGFVKGGTTSWEHDKKVKKDFLEAEQRRDALEAEKKIAATPLSQGGGKMWSHQLTTEQESGLPEAKVDLHFVNSKGEPKYDHGEPLRCLADVKIPDDPAYDGELMLLIFCPRCVRRLPAAECIIQIRQSNRSWHLDARRAGELIMWPEWVKGLDGKLHKVIETYRSAGVVMDSEKFTCARCDWKGVIDKNKIWPV